MTFSKDNDQMINRSQMVHIAREHNLFVSRSTIHRWANERDLPLPVGQDGRYLLYSRREFVAYLARRLRRILEEHLNRKDVSSGEIAMHYYNMIFCSCSLLSGT